MAETINAEEFVETWQKSGSVREMAQKMGISEKTAGARASYMRQKGVVLKTMAAGGGVGRYDFPKLKRIAEENAP